MTIKDNFVPGRGIDIGTGFLAVATMDKEGVVHTKSVRDSFLELKPSNKLIYSTMKKSLVKAGINFLEVEDHFILLGDDSLLQSVERQLVVKRPMAKGVISPKEAKALPMFRELLKELLGEPIVQNEKVIFSVPSSPTDAPFDVEYHKSVIESILKTLGYSGQSINESHALVFSELSEDEYTGTTLSCLLSDQEILTAVKFKKISDINIGDKVLGKNGKFNKVYSTNVRDFDGDIYKIKVSGYSEPINITYNHKVLVVRENDKIWVEAKDLKIGDIITEATLQENLNATKQRIYLRKTKHDNKRTILTSRPLCRFVGYFLGDGHISSRGNEVCFTINSKSTEIIEDIKDITTRVLGVKTQIIKKDSGAVRIQLAKVALAEWLKKNCYEEDIKKVPFKLEDLTRTEVIGLIEGLIATDGNISKDKIGFCTTSSYLAAAFHYLLSRLGVFANISIRKPRKGGILKTGRQIYGKKKVYQFSIRGFYKKILEMYLNSEQASKVYSTAGEYVSTITNIGKYKYTGKVFDIGVENAESFCLPYITLHNCGAGMTNVCIANMADIITTFAVAKGGDYIDYSAAVSLGYDPNDPKGSEITPNLITYIKEQGVDIINPDDKDKIQIAISSYYRVLIKYIVSSIVNELNKLTTKPKFLNPISILISGGTSLAKGFTELFTEEITKVKSQLPFEIKGVQKAKKPMTAVAEGALIALLSDNT